MAALNSLTTLSRSYTGEYIEILVQNLNICFSYSKTNIRVCPKSGIIIFPSPALMKGKSFVFYHL